MPTWAKIIPYLRMENLKTMPYPAAHTYIAYIWEYPHERGWGGVQCSSGIPVHKDLQSSRLIHFHGENEEKKGVYSVCEVYE